jgi:hypothetical protein
MKIQTISFALVLAFLVITQSVEGLRNGGDKIVPCKVISYWTPCKNGERYQIEKCLSGNPPGCNDCSAGSAGETCSNGGGNNVNANVNVNGKGNSVNINVSRKRSVKPSVKRSVKLRQ